ncbi:hypothetical protein [Streptomyces bacillaris]|uniref:hypothetical protein n=1 Tax=Streptomyces bacillaris TaxID=68179 RepID=UPI00345F27B3
MDLIASGVATAGIKAAGSPLGALIGRYRPTGVPRLGSKEDRAGAYHRMLDASTRTLAYSYQFANLRREARRASYKLLTAQLPALDPGSWTHETLDPEDRRTDISWS